MTKIRVVERENDPIKVRGVSWSGYEKLRRSHDRESIHAYTRLPIGSGQESSPKNEQPADK